MILNTLLLTICLLAVPCLPALGETSSTKNEGKNILFIGNSYTAQIRKTVTDLIKSSPHSKTKLTFISPGGKTLAFHLTNKKTVQTIKDGKYDFVILQDQSQTPAVFPKKFSQAAIGLNKVIKQSGAQTVFYQTWGRRDGDKQNKKLFPTYESMQKALSKSYSSTSQACKATLAPVGDTWSSLRKKNPKIGRELYRNDGSHPSAKGAYLAACVFYSTLFNEDPRKLKFLGGLPGKEAQLIQQLAFDHRSKH